MTAAECIAIIEAVVLEQLAEHDEELTTAQRKVIADQIAREAWRRLMEVNAQMLSANT